MDNFVNSFFENKGKPNFVYDITNDVPAPKRSNILTEFNTTGVWYLPARYSTGNGPGSSGTEKIYNDNGDFLKIHSIKAGSISSASINAWSAIFLKRNW